MGMLGGKGLRTYRVSSYPYRYRQPSRHGHCDKRQPSGA